MKAVDLTRRRVDAGPACADCSYAFRLALTCWVLSLLASTDVASILAPEVGGEDDLRVSLCQRGSDGICCSQNRLRLCCFVVDVGW